MTALKCPEGPALLAETEELRWLYKPPGLPVFPPHDDPQGPSLLAALPQLGSMPLPDFPQGFEGGLAHRLDTSTSGIVLAARTPEALVSLRALFSGGRLEKRYRFIARNDVPWHEHLLELPIGHHPSRRDRMVVQRGPNTQARGHFYPAHTRLRRVEGRLWEAVITTGVMHQIRAHAASVGLALLGDHLYGGGALPAGLAPPGVRFCLHHAETLGLPGPQVSVLSPSWWPRSGATPPAGG
ncbi:MAG: RNA pseudouridine synthase [Deltaproteobacteria bacterium]|nr:RNA pseudouridine synthase [Deltaproteobacteria bacterium]